MSLRLSVLLAVVAHASAYSAVSHRSALRSSRVATPVVRAPVTTCTYLMSTKTGVKAFVVGVAADSGCGKSTFMRRLTNIFGGKTALLDIGRETNTLVSDKTTVICLDDYHKFDRKGRSENKITALHKDCQKWDLMAEQVHARCGCGRVSGVRREARGSLRALRASGREEGFWRGGERGMGAVAPPSASLSQGRARQSGLHSRAGRSDGSLAFS
jgi:hypothetical protein